MYENRGVIFPKDMKSDFRENILENKVLIAIQTL